MKIRSLLNNNKNNLIRLAVLLSLGTGGFLLLTPSKDTHVTLYHQSNWNHYAPEVERALEQAKNVEKLKLSHVYGGVLPHHIPTTIPQMVEMYERLKKTQVVKKIIIIGPDHTDAGMSPVTVSSANFITTFGQLRPIEGLALKLQEDNLATVEEAPFDEEHSIGTHMLLISKIFPDAEVTPIIIRSDTTKGHAEVLGVALAEYLDEETILIASVDFSHYLSTNQAGSLDRISGEVLRNLDTEAISLVEADSNKSTLVFVKAMNEKKATASDAFSILNTNDFMQNTDYTTGYVFGFFGTGLGGGTSLEDKEVIDILFTGDIMLSRAVGRIMIRNNDWQYPFLKMAKVLQDADITFGNLENPISDRGTKVGSIYSFQADPKSVEGLSYAGFDVVSIANNHIWDYGREAFEDTLSILQNNGIKYVGGGLTYEEAHNPVIKEVRGTKIAFLAYTNLLPSFLGLAGDKPTVAFPNENQMVLDIQKAKQSADIVVVSFHWGEEYMTTHNSVQEKLGRLAIDTGANIVVGHHPHVVQGVEKYKDGYILYSLGNFVFDQNFSEDTKQGLIVTATIKNKKVEKITPQKIEFNSSYQPFIP